MKLRILSEKLELWLCAQCDFSPKVTFLGEKSQFLGEKKSEFKEKVGILRKK